MFRNVLAFVLGLLSFGWLNANTPPAPMPVVRCIIHTNTKRAYAKVLGVGRSVRMVFNFLRSIVNAPLARAGYALQAGTLNMFLDPLPTFPFQAAAQKENMPRSVYLRELLVRVSGTLTIAGGNNNCTLRTEPIARLIRRFNIRWDGYELVAPISGRDLAALSRRVTLQTLSGVPITTANTGVTNFELNFVVPFARYYNADPFETALPPLQVRKEFVCEIEWEQSLANAVVGTTAGSGAIATGGTDSVALTNVQAVVTPRQARNAGAPWFIPQISVYETQQFVAANPRLTLRMDSPEAFDGVLLRTLNGAAQDPADLITDVTFETKSVKVLNAVLRQQLVAMEEAAFGGVVRAQEVGTQFIQFNDAKLGNVVNPAELTLPEFRFNVGAPGGGGPAIVRAVVMECLSIQGVTRR